MTYSALPQLHVACMAALRNNAGFMALVAGVYDEVPETPTFPYVAIDDPFEVPNRTFGQNGHDCTITFSIFAQSPSTTKAGRGKAGYVVGLNIAEVLIGLLTDIESAPLTVAGHDLVDADVVSLEAFREDDGKTRRVDVTVGFTAETTP